MVIQGIRSVVHRQEGRYSTWIQALAR